jgi:acetyl-CoA C-acetyltransferase
MQALKKLYGRLNGFNPKDVGIVEMSETSAAQALALADEFGFDDALLNPDGGAVVRGHPLGAAGAVLVVRLFTRMVRVKDPKAPRLGIATLGTIGGMGLAALFEAV